MSTMNGLRHIDERVRQRRTSRTLAIVRASGRGFSPIEDDFFARESELYQAGPAGDELETPECSEGGSRRSLVLGAAAVTAATVFVFLVRFQPNVLQVHALTNLWRKVPAGRAAPSAVVPVPQPAATLKASSRDTLVQAPVGRLKLEEVHSPQEAASEAPGAREPRVVIPRRAARSSAKVASAMAKCRTEASADHVRRALDACRQAVALQPRSPEALTLLAHAEIDRHHAREAQRLATAAISSDPGFSDAYVMVGKARQQEGQKSKARASFQQYLALAPHGRYAPEVRTILSRGL